MISDETVKKWISLIGNYKLEKDCPKQLKAAGFSIDQFLSKEAQTILYDSSHSKEESKAKREAFLRFLAQKFQAVKSLPENKHTAIPMVSFLGEEGLKLYHEAIKEEAESKAFRTAVFFKSLNFCSGKKWAQRLILWIGGPSSSGKTYASKKLIEKLDKDILNKTEEESDNPFVSIDGSIERSVSQMRQMVLQFALATGYKGIKDLHKHSSGLSIKSRIQKASLADAKLNLIIPTTFVHSLFSLKKQFLTYKNSNFFQIFSEVKGEVGFEERFKTSVKNMGENRAWNRIIFSEDSIKMNNRSMDGESKVYESQFFNLGLHATAIFKGFYKLFSVEKTTLALTNDFIYLVKKGETWEEAKYREDLTEKKEGLDFIRMTNRTYKKWLKQKSSQNLEDWFENTGKFLETSTEPLITLHKIKDNRDSFSFFNRFKPKKSSLSISHISHYIDLPFESKEKLVKQSQISTVMQANNALQEEASAQKLKANTSRIHYVSLKSASKDPLIYLVEKFNPNSGLKVSFLKDSVEHDTNSLLIGSLTMAKSLLQELEQAPTALNPIKLSGYDPEYIRYLWTALIVLGKKSSSIKFNASAIHGYEVTEEKHWFGLFRSNSLHETVFKSNKLLINQFVKQLDDKRQENLNATINASKNTCNVLG